MLPHEVEPFADAHIEALDTIINEMQTCIANPEKLNPEVIPEWRNDLIDCVHGFMQFKASMTYELKEKEKIDKFLHDNKIVLNTEASS